jgi:hypothetical protein
MTIDKAWRSGLEECKAVGRVARYREWACTDEAQLATIVRRGDNYFTAGPRGYPLLSLELPESYTRHRRSRSWTGETLDYEWDGDGVSVEARTTLPGPLFRPRKRTLRFRWAFKNAPAFMTDLESGRKARCGMENISGRIFLCDSGRMPSLVVLSKPASLQVISHEHWTLNFESDGGTCLWIPLLEANDAPTQADIISRLLMLVESPPLSCSESYCVTGNVVELRQTFPGSKLAPLPPVPALLGSLGNLQKLPQATVLLKTLIGPYSVVDGDHWTGSIELGWTKAKLEPTREVRGPLSPIPHELAYAGDVTWEPGTPMDQCLALRLFAPLAGVLPDSIWEEVRPQLTPPTPAALKASLTTIVEPTTKRKWSKEAKLFEHNSDVSYDSDWYTGLTLSCLYAAMCCRDPRVAQLARETAAACKAERENMAAYFEIFHDWALFASWSDPRGELFNVDCAHNGMEGVLAEAGMRELEGDAAGRDRMLYLAGKMAVAFVAMFELPEWCRITSFVLNEEASPLGVYAMYETSGIGVDSHAGKTAYSLAGNFPAYCALLKKHGPMEKLRRLAEAYNTQHPERYDDWAKFYTGIDADTALTSLQQEERVQAAVFYHLSMDVSLRLWVLDEDADQVEARFKKPLNLVEQVWCRAAARLKV